MSIIITETIRVYQRLSLWLTPIWSTPRGGTSRFTSVLKTKKRATSSTWQSTCVFSGFCREVVENYNLLGYYMASSGNFLPTLQDNLSVPSQRSRIQNSWPYSTVLLAEYMFVTMCCSHQVHPFTIFISTERCVQRSERPVHRHAGTNPPMRLWSHHLTPPAQPTTDTLKALCLLSTENFAGLY